MKGVRMSRQTVAMFVGAASVVAIGLTVALVARADAAVKNKALGGVALGSTASIERLCLTRDLFTNPDGGKPVPGVAAEVNWSVRLADGGSGESFKDSVPLFGIETALLSNSGPVILPKVRRLHGYEN